MYGVHHPSLDLAGLQQHCWAVKTQAWSAFPLGTVEVQLLLIQPLAVQMELAACNSGM